MILNNIEIKNYRCFEDLQLHFNKRMNVIVGNNGAGKSSILDAISIGIGSFLLGIESSSAPGINKYDARNITYVMGSSLEKHTQFPVTISCDGVIDKREIKWSRQLKSINGSTTYGDAYTIKDIATNLQNSIKKGDTSIALPIISYYGTGRLWAQKKAKRYNYKNTLINRFSGYIDCLSSISNEKLMLKWFSKMTMQELQLGKNMPELVAVKKAIATCYQDSGSNVSDINIIFNIQSDELEISFLGEDGNRVKQSFHELSDGFKNTLSLVADISYRMAILNPQYLGDVNEKTTGIILIDEIDQHLHPLWQKKILSSLMKIFPNVQFIVTTHSPSIISSAQKEQLIVLDGKEAYTYNDNVYGKDVNSVLSDIMGVSSRPDEIMNAFDKFYDSLEKADYSKARSILKYLSDKIGENDKDIISANIALDFEED